MEQHKVKPGKKIALSKWDPNDKSTFDGDKKSAKKHLKALNDELEILQETLYAEHKHKVLVVLQGMDTSGKDGTIRHVFEGVNPQGVHVASFKKPTDEELDHDYLWRVHQKVPARGEIVIFNRSHYEDVLVVRVHELVPPTIWEKRYKQINNFEKMLAEEGVTILKFFLHINLEEQKERLLARLNTPEKRWKFRRKDVAERKYWWDYMSTFEDVLNKTSTEWAPWYIVPANRKWYRNLVVASVLVETLKGLNIQYPQPEDNLDDVVIE